MKFLLTTAALLGAAVPALAQTDPRLQVEQISPQASARVDLAVPSARPPLAATQLSTPQAGGDSRPGQVSRPGPQGPTAQLSGRDRNPRLAAIPPGMVDACEEAAAGRRPPPDDIDCATVLEAVAFAEQPEPSAEEALLASSAEQAQGRESARASLDRTPNADAIANRLASGDVQDAPIAQAVGAGFTQPPEGLPSAPPGSVPVILPGRSGGVTVAPPTSGG